MEFATLKKKDPLWVNLLIAIILIIIFLGTITEQANLHCK